MSETEELKSLAGAALDWIRAQGEPGLEAELYLARGEERGVELRDGALDGIQQSSADGVGLRLLRDGRMAFASAGGLSLEAIQQLYKRALPQLPYLQPDAAKGFAAQVSGGDDETLAASLWDETLFREEWAAILPRLEAMQKAALAQDKRIQSVLRVDYGESRSEVVIAGTRGLLRYERGGSASVGLSALCEEDGELQVGSSFQAARRKADLDFARVAREGAQRTVVLLGSRKLPSARRDVVFDPWVSGELLELISGLLCADQVQRGKSLLAGKLGQKVGSQLLTFIDDPRLPGGSGSSLYDDEGLPTSRKAVVEAGVVKEYFYDVYTANKEGRSSNGCAGRGSFKGLPGPGCSNFFLAKGSISRDKLLSGTKDGILVLDVMGMHMADPISGEFSVGVSGLSIKDGKLGHAVKSAMVSGNLLELLERVDAVADDLTFYGALGAPTFRVRDMTVA